MNACNLLCQLIIPSIDCTHECFFRNVTKLRELRFSMSLNVVINVNFMSVQLH